MRALRATAAFDSEEATVSAMIPDVEHEPAIHDQVLVEAQLESGPVRLRAVVVNVQPNSLWLGLVRPDEALERLERNQPVRLTFRADNAGVIAETTFLAHLGATRSRLFSVGRPARPQVVQRRATVRVEVERPVEIRVLNQGPMGSAGRTGSGTTWNISEGGMQFATDLPVAIGDDLELALTLEPNEPVRAEAQVVRVEDIDEADERRTRGRRRLGESKPNVVAVRFLAISQIDQDRIVRQIFSVQRQRRDDRKLA